MSFHKGLIGKSSGGGSVGRPEHTIADYIQTLEQRNKDKLTFEEWLNVYQKRDGTYPYGYDSGRSRDFLCMGVPPLLVRNCVERSTGECMIPEGTTHVWTPAIETPQLSGWGWKVFRRGCYKKVEEVWYSYNAWGTWVPSGNDQKWFDEETQLGYFVSVETYLAPGFVPVKEIV